MVTHIDHPNRNGSQNIKLLKIQDGGRRGNAIGLTSILDRVQFVFHSLTGGQRARHALRHSREYYEYYSRPFNNGPPVQGTMR